MFKARYTRSKGDCRRPSSTSPSSRNIPEAWARVASGKARSRGVKYTADNPCGTGRAAVTCGLPTRCAVYSALCLRLPYASFFFCDFLIAPHVQLARRAETNTWKHAPSLEAYSWLALATHQPMCWSEILLTLLSVSFHLFLFWGFPTCRAYTVIHILSGFHAQAITPYDIQ